MKFYEKRQNRQISTAKSEISKPHSVFTPSRLHSNMKVLGKSQNVQLFTSQMVGIIWGEIVLSECRGNFPQNLLDHSLHMSTQLGWRNNLPLTKRFFYEK